MRRLWERGGDFPAFARGNGTDRADEDGDSGSGSMGNGGGGTGDEKAGAVVTAVPTDPVAKATTLIVMLIYIPAEENSVVSSLFIATRTSSKGRLSRALGAGHLHPEARWIGFPIASDGLPRALAYCSRVPRPTGVGDGEER